MWYNLNWRSLKTNRDIKERNPTPPKNKKSKTSRSLSIPDLKNQKKRGKEQTREGKKKHGGLWRVVTISGSKRPTDKPEAERNNLPFVSREPCKAALCVPARSQPSIIAAELHPLGRPK